MVESGEDMQVEAPEMVVQAMRGAMDAALWGRRSFFDPASL
jgi:hypothetical protein